MANAINNFLTKLALAAGLVVSTSSERTIAANTLHSTAPTKPEEIEVVSTTPGSFAEKVRNGTITPLDKSDLEHSSFRKLEQIARQHGHTNLPVYLDSGNPPHIKLVETETNAFFVADIGSIQVTPAYAKKHLMPSDAHISELLKSGKIVDLRTLTHHADLVHECDVLAHKMGLKTPPAYYIDKSGEFLVPMGPTLMARTTQNGKSIVFMTDVDLNTNNLPRRLLRAYLGHELGHLKHNDSSAEGIATIFNDNAVSQRKEIAADIASAIEGRQPMAEALQYLDDLDKKDFFSVNPEATVADYADYKRATTADLTHPSMEQRTQKIQEAERNAATNNMHPNLTIYSHRGIQLTPHSSTKPTEPLLTPTSNVTNKIKGR